MSALWTPSRVPDRLCEVMAAEPSTLTPGPAALLPAWSPPAPAQGPDGHGSTPAPPPESTRVGLLHEDRDPLTKGCTYCTKAPPTPSTPNPRPLAPHPRAVHPDDDGSHQSHRVSPLRQAEAAALPSGRHAQPAS